MQIWHDVRGRIEAWRVNPLPLGITVNDHGRRRTSAATAPLVAELGPVREQAPERDAVQDFVHATRLVNGAVTVMRRREAIDDPSAATGTGHTGARDVVQSAGSAAEAS